MLKETVWGGLIVLTKYFEDRRILYDSKKHLEQN